MRIYEVRMSLAAYSDMAQLRVFLKDMLSEEGAIRYANNMRAEIKMLSVYAECYGRFFEWNESEALDLWSLIRTKWVLRGLMGKKGVDAYNEQ